jgi:hypothetical protein
VRHQAHQLSPGQPRDIVGAAQPVLPRVRQPGQEAAHARIVTDQQRGTPSRRGGGRDGGDERARARQPCADVGPGRRPHGRRPRPGPATAAPRPARPRSWPPAARRRPAPSARWQPRPWSARAGSGYLNRAAVSPQIVQDVGQRGPDLAGFGPAACGQDLSRHRGRPGPTSPGPPGTGGRLVGDAHRLGVTHDEQLRRGCLICGIRHVPLYRPGTVRGRSGARRAASDLITGADSSQRVPSTPCCRAAGVGVAGLALDNYEGTRDRLRIARDLGDALDEAQQVARPDVGDRHRPGAVAVTPGGWPFAREGREPARPCRRRAS